MKPWDDEPTIWQGFVEMIGQREELVHARYEYLNSKTRQRYNDYRAGFMYGGCS